MTKEETNEAIVRLQAKLKQVCINDKIKFESDKFYEVQAAMVAGALAVFNDVPVVLGIAIMARRPIIDPYKF